MDLSFTPRVDFRARGPKFKLIYGDSLEPKFTPPSSPEYLFGLAVHHLVRARICIERGKLWRVEYLIGEARNHVLSLACLDRGLPSNYARGFDNLSSEVLKPFEETLVGQLDRRHLLDTVVRILHELLRKSETVRDAALSLEPQLRELESAVMK